MNVFLLILAGIIVLILLLLFCPVVIKIEYKDKVKIKAGYLFPVFTIPTEKEEDPEKAAKKAAKKEKREQKKQLKEERRRQKYEKKHPGAAAAASAEPEKKKESPFIQKIKEKGVSGIIELLKELVRIIGGLLKKITDHLVISKFDLQIAIASEDAASTALTYGRICSGVYPAVSFIKNHVRKFRHRIKIAPVFTQTETKVRLVMKARIMPFFILSGALGALIKGLKAIAK